MSSVAGEPHDVPTFKEIGEPERGYALRVTTTTAQTMPAPEGTVGEFRSINEVEVTELSTAALDPALFEIPAGFKLVEMIRQDPTPPLIIRWKQQYDRFLYRARGRRRNRA
jgi:hypothetical protein